MIPNSEEIPILFTHTSANTKTGPTPQAFAGTNFDESLSTCQEVRCPLLPKRYGGDNGVIRDKDGNILHELKPCYAWQGTARMAFGSMCRSKDRAEETVSLLEAKPDLSRSEKRELKKAKSKYTLAAAMAKASRGAKMIRMTAIGDAGLLPKSTASTIKDEAKKAGLKIVGYTRAWRHHPERSAHWQGVLMASTMTLDEADQAIDQGWRASTVLAKDHPVTGHKRNRFTTPKGRKGVICPNMIDASITCNNCRLCGGPKGPVIGFFTHK